MYARILIALALLAPAWVTAAEPATTPVQFQGRWASTRNQCNIPHEGRLTLYPDRVEFHESRGKILSVSSRGPLEIELNVELTGEGETSHRVLRFVLSKDGRTLTDVTNRPPVARVHCD